MRLKSSLMGIAVTLAFAVFSPTIARADLLGSEVTAVSFFPTETTFALPPIGPIPVTSGVPPEFPAGSLSPIDDGSLAVTGTEIIWTAAETEIYPAGVASPPVSAFDGFDVAFTGAPAITDVTVDPASTIPPVPFSGFPASSPTGISFNSFNVFVDLAGDSVAVGDQLILDVQTVPEPGAMVLLGSALVILAGYKSRVFRKA